MSLKNKITRLGLLQPNFNSHINVTGSLLELSSTLAPKSNNSNKNLLYTPPLQTIPTPGFTPEGSFGNDFDNSFS
jgi:hypothetical protein